MIKKLVALCLVVIATLSLVACGNDNVVYEKKYGEDTKELISITHNKNEVEKLTISTEINITSKAFKDFVKQNYNNDLDKFRKDTETKINDQIKSEFKSGAVKIEKVEYNKDKTKIITDLVADCKKMSKEDLKKFNMKDKFLFDKYTSVLEKNGYKKI